MLSDRGTAGALVVFVVVCLPYHGCYRNRFTATVKLNILVHYKMSATHPICLEGEGSTTTRQK